MLKVESNAENIECLYLEIDSLYSGELHKAVSDQSSYQHIMHIVQQCLEEPFNFEPGNIWSEDMATMRRSW